MSTKSPIRATTLTTASSQSQSAHGCSVSASSSAMQQCMLAASSTVASICFPTTSTSLASSSSSTKPLTSSDAWGLNAVLQKVGTTSASTSGAGRQVWSGTVGSRGDANDALRGMKQKSSSEIRYSYYLIPVERTMSFVLYRYTALCPYIPYLFRLQLLSWGAEQQTKARLEEVRGEEPGR